MMRKKIVTLSVLLACLCAAQSASGIPYTGSTDYSVVDPETGRTLSGTIDFGVFDRQVDDFAFTPPGEGRYIYAYQIFNDQGDIQEAVGYFAILLEGAPTDGIGADAWEGDTLAVEPTNFGIDSLGDAVFHFKSTDPNTGLLLGEDILQPGGHSYVLIFTSDNDWKPGEYEIRGGGLTNRETDFVPTDTPEPATILILGMGAGMGLLVKRKSS